MKPEPVELSDFTTELFIKARTMGERDWQLGSCAEGHARLDPQRITQAVLNLTRNAFEHAPPDSTITVGSEVVGGTVRFWVHDSGPTIDEAERERIFERFSRGGQRRRGADGAGLGLSITKAVAEAHGGRAWLEPGDAGGNRFVIELPGAVEHDDDAYGAEAGSAPIASGVHR